MSTISIIIPSYNYASFISETLESIIKQNYEQWECLVIDDGSSDATEAVVRPYAQADARIRYIYQNNQGVSTARNNGLAQATGEYIQFLDADDLLAPGKLLTHVRFLEAHPTVDIVYSDSRYFANGDLTRLSYSLDMQNLEWLPKVDEQENTAITYLVEQNLMPIQAALSRRTLLQKVGSFDTAIRYCEDWDYWFRCAVAGGRFFYLDSTEALSYIRVHNISASQNNAALAAGAKVMRSKAFAYIERNPGAVSPAQYAAMRRTKALELVKDKHYSAGIGLFLRTIGKTNTSHISFKDILYWVIKSASAPTS